jgi:malonate-semialdehyde dehydrogenase (acetylating)/methylmalonate-semialdehyde dehydrogenase
MTRIPYYVNGKHIDGGVRTAPVFNPALGTPVKQVALASPGEVSEAVELARQAQLAWRSTSLTRRADVFFRLRQLLVEHKEELAQLVSEEHGKTVADAAGGVTNGAGACWKKETVD